jgi:hypothetical protein
MRADEFARQFAIRMPDGRLFGHPPQVEDVPDYSQSSAMRDVKSMYSLLGLSTSPTQSTPKPGPVIFDTRDAAESKLADLRSHAEQVGVMAWGGVVVERMCTAFTSGDPSVEFANEVVRWISQQGGVQ